MAPSLSSHLSGTSRWASIHSTLCGFNKHLADCVSEIKRVAVSQRRFFGWNVHVWLTLSPSHQIIFGVIRRSIIRVIRLIHRTWAVAVAPATVLVRMCPDRCLVKYRASFEDDIRQWKRPLWNFLALPPVDQFFFTGLCHSGPMAGNLDEQLSKSVTQLECTDATSAGCDGPIDRISSSDPRAVRPLPPADWQLAGPLFHPHFVSFPRKQ